MTLTLRYHARSVQGFYRSNNEDSVFAGHRLLALADGVGGHAAGEVASSLVISEMAPLNDRRPGPDLLGDLRDAALRGNAAIARHIAHNPELEGMATTLTALLFDGDRVGLVHVGDSRAYRLRDDVLRQITKDETLVQSLVDQGQLTIEEALKHPARSVVLRAVMGQELDPWQEELEAQAGDRYMICSDGLSDFVPPATLEEILRADLDPSDCVQQLVETALRADGQDNISCIVSDIVEGDSGYDIPIITGAARH
jgi:serine/threonine protein phosphatase PrpC